MSRRIAVFVITATSLLAASSALAGQHFPAHSTRHVAPQRIAPAPHSVARHVEKSRHVTMIRRGRAFDRGFLGFGGGYGAAAAAVAEVPAGLYPAEAAPAGYPYVRPDPQWLICQIGATTDRYYECGPNSYHPFGAYGYRPNGTYGDSSGAPTFVVAPNAKIIHIDGGK